MDASKLVAVRTKHNGSAHILLIHGAEPNAFSVEKRIGGPDVRVFTALCQINRELTLIPDEIPFMGYKPHERCGRCTKVAETGVPHVKRHRNRNSQKKVGSESRVHLSSYDINAIPPGTITVAADEPFDIKAFYDDVIAFAQRNNISEHQMTVLAGVHGAVFRRNIRPSVSVCAALAVVCDLRLDDYCRAYTGKLTDGSRERSSSSR